jgi:tight adherence protein B
MLMVVAGGLLGGACVAFWCLRLAVEAGRKGLRWVGEETEAELERLFVFVSSRRLVAGTALAMVLCLVCGILSGTPPVILVAICALLAAAPRLLTAMLGRKRRRQLIQQLPDALRLWAGLLRSGLGMSAALLQLASRQPGPLGEELRLVLGETRLGVPLDRAVSSLCERTGAADLRLLSTLLHTHRELGGNLAEALERLSVTLRSRLAMEARIQSLTAQGRMQGTVVGLLPLFLALVLSFMEPAAMHALVSTRAGAACIALILALEVTGYLLIRRIVRIDP